MNIKEYISYLELENDLLKKLLKVDSNKLHYWLGVIDYFEDWLINYTNAYDPTDLDNIDKANLHLLIEVLDKFQELKGSDKE